MKQAYNTSALEETTDFFDRVWEASVMKVEYLKKHPHIASFIASVAAEPMPELKGAIFSETNEKYIASLVLHEQDYKKFRHPEDAELVFQMLMLLAKGMSVQLENGVDYDGMMKEFREILRRNSAMSEPVIALNKLTKSYGKHRGIEEISFTVERAEIFGFIGPNGAGKSTTIRTLMGLLKPTGGTASVFGLDCWRQASEIAKDVGYLPSENCYYNSMKVKEMLLYTAELYGVDGHNRMEALAERLNFGFVQEDRRPVFGQQKESRHRFGFATLPKVTYHGRAHQRS